MFDGVGSSTRPDIVSKALARSFNYRTLSEPPVASSRENISESALLEVADSDRLRQESRAALSWAVATELSNGHQRLRDKSKIAASTACVVRLFSFGPEGNRQHMIHTANAGDGFWILLRRQAGLWRSIAHSEPSFHNSYEGKIPPLQLAYDSHGTWITKDDMHRVHYARPHVLDGDIVLAMSDGVVDNLPIENNQGQSHHGSVAEWIVKRMNRDTGIEWTPASLKEYFRRRIGEAPLKLLRKPDDYTVVAARVSIGLGVSAPMQSGSWVFPALRLPR